MRLIFKTTKDLEKVAGIVRDVCRITGISFFDLKTITGNENITTARHLAIYWVYQRNKDWLSIRKTAFFFDTNRKEVKRIIRDVGNKMVLNKDFFDKVNDYFNE